MSGLEQRIRDVLAGTDGMQFEQLNNYFADFDPDDLDDALQNLSIEDELTFGAGGYALKDPD